MVVAPRIERIAQGKIYVKTGDGRWWASEWPSEDAQPTWELLEGIKPCLGKPDEIIEIVPGINIYQYHFTEFPFAKDTKNEEKTLD